MLHTLTPLGNTRDVNVTACRNSFKMRNLAVFGDTIHLKDYVSCYSIDLSGVNGGNRSFYLDVSKVHQKNHEIANFELAVIMPPVNPPTVSFQFVDRWLDFCGPWRFQPGKIHFISIFKEGSSWFGAMNGCSCIQTKKQIYDRTGVFPGNTVILDDYTQTYVGTVSESETEFSFITENLETSKQLLCFDMILNIETDSPKVSFPVSRWFDFCYPARPFQEGSKHVLTFLTLDGGENWIGRYNNLL